MARHRFALHRRLRPRTDRTRIVRNARQIWIGYTLLAFVAIPWYWRWVPGATSLVSGVPAWAAGAIFGSALISCYTAWLLSFRWPDESSGEGDQ